MSITELAIKRPILIIVLFLVLGLAGIFSYTQLRYELLPDITTPSVTLTTVWPGAAPAEVETAFIKPLEDAVAGANARAPLARLARLARSAAALEADLATRLAPPAGTAPVLTDSLGAPGAAPLALAEASLLTPAPTSNTTERATKATAVAQALAQRPEVQQLALAADLSRQQVAVARARALPTMALFGQYSTTSQAADFSFRDQRWPQTAYLGCSSACRSSAPLRPPAPSRPLAALQAEQQQLALATRVTAEARTTLADLQSARDQLAVQALTVRAAARAYALVHQRWQLGMAKWTDLADAEEQLNQARANRLPALYDYRTADLDYQQALGKGA